MRITVSLLCFLFIAGISVQAQSIGDWTTYTSLRTVNDLSVDSQEQIWAATTGGVLSTNKDGEFINLTTKEGLSRMDATSIIYDESNEQVIVGYVDGVLDVINIESGQIISLNDIERNQNFTSKSINDFIVQDNRLYVATDFGIVVYNLAELYVEDSFIQLGEFIRASSIQDIFIENDTMYAVTVDGIAYGNLNDELSINSSWDIINNDNSPIEDEVVSVGVRNERLYVSSVGGNYVRDGSTWSSFTGFGSETIIEFIKNEGLFAAYSERSVYRYNSSSDSFDRNRPSSIDIQRATAADGQIYVGTASDGIGMLSGGNDIQLIEIEGPYQNYFSGLRVDNGKLISGSTNQSARDASIDNAKGYYIFDGENWENYNQKTNAVIDDFKYQQSFTTTITEDYYYFGSWGRGVARHRKEDRTIQIFDETNSTLRGWVDDNDQFPVISGLQTDTNDDVWLVSRYGSTPLYYQTPGDDNWVPLPKANAASSSDEYYGLFIDSYDQKWITLENTSTAGNGLIVLNTGQDPATTSDDESVKLMTGSNSGNLPDNKVNAIVQDLEGEVWIGTGRGIARFIFPELIIDGGPQEREAQWLINEDTTASSRFLLRDVNVSAMAVNAANEKWIGSVNQGIWVLNAEGSRIVDRFTSENSPLYSNSIVSIAIDDETGEVFIATDVGLISYHDIPKAPVQNMDELKVFPNPFSYSENSRIAIEGLSDATNLKIVGVDGIVVRELEARGGRIEWDGLNYNGNQLGSGVYLVVAYEGDSRQTGLGKVVIVR